MFIPPIHRKRMTIANVTHRLAFTVCSKSKPLKCLLAQVMPTHNEKYAFFILRLRGTVWGVWFHVNFNLQQLLHCCYTRAENHAVWSQWYWQALQEQRDPQLAWTCTYGGSHYAIFLNRNLTLRERSSAVGHCARRPCTCSKWWKLFRLAFSVGGKNGN